MREDTAGACAAEHAEKTGADGGTPSVTQTLHQLAQLNVIDRIALIGGGVPSSIVTPLIEALGLSTAQLATALGMTAPTLARKLRTHAALSAVESERVLGLVQLVEQSERWAEHVEASTPPGVRVSQWLGTWLTTPSPALGGHAPLTLLDTADGRRLVGDLLGSLESGAYW